MASKSKLEKTVDYVIAISTYEYENYRKSFAFQFVQDLRWDNKINMNEILEMTREELNVMWELWREELHQKVKDNLELMDE